MKNPLIPIGIVLTVLVLIGLICANSAMGTGATANNTLTNIANINMSEAVKSQSRALERSFVTIDHQNTNTLLIVIAGSVALIVIAIGGYRIINMVISIANGNAFHPGRPAAFESGGGMPGYITLDIDRARTYIKSLSPTQRLEMQNRLYVIESILQEYEMQANQSIVKW